ncbi:MAG: DALR anticodon-binding domain-containing protein [Trichodesmium sp.]
MQKSVNLYQEKLKWSGYEKKLDICDKIETIPILQTRDSNQLLYKSAIALKLAPVCQQRAIDIANELAKYCGEVVNNETKKERLNFQLEVVSSGMINFKIEDLSIANWLDDLSYLPLNCQEKKLQVVTEGQPFETRNLFPIQYSHARCCSLLRMGEDDRLISLTPAKAESYSQCWFIETPQPIPWQKLNGELQFLDNSEYQLIAQIAFTLDRIYCLSHSKKSVNWKKVADALSLAFQTFYGECRIWGKVKIKTPKLAQSRLGLVLVTQSLLRFLLEEKLGEKALIEL